ncbi:MAG: GNAT family N-acetyltransferase [Anaerolineales bacterium]
MIFRSFNPFEDINFTKGIWLELQSKSQYSYFTSWEWMSTWINSLPKETKIHLIVGYQETNPVLAFFAGQTKRKKHGFLPTKVMALNTTGNSYFDELTIEYNSILFDPNSSLDKNALFNFIRTFEWDEFILQGVSQDFISSFSFPEVASQHFNLVTDKVSVSHYVELQKIRDAGMDYLQLLSSNKRSQIRRSIKQYEENGKIQIVQATNTSEALSMLDELASLHQKAWQDRGEAGSFSNEYFYQFHKSLIQNSFDHGKIQLLRVFNEQMTIGIIYNFIHMGRILFYQSGLNYSNGNNYRPGLVSHYYAITYNAGLSSMVIYDFLAGDTDYKRSLGTDSTQIYWLRLVKSSFRLNFETNFVNFKKTIKKLVKRESNK